VNLIGLEFELWHRGMAGDNSFGKYLAERFDGIAQAQGVEWRCRLERALAARTDGTAPCAMGPRVGASSLCPAEEAAKAGLARMSATMTWHRTIRNIRRTMLKELRSG
jgi:hypothetical protein